VYVQPRASRSRLVGPYEGALKISITAAPVGGEANKSLILLLSKLWKIPRAAFSITSGAQSRYKTVHVDGVGSLAGLIPSSWEQD